jgi:glutathione S-transferase
MSSLHIWGRLTSINVRKVVLCVQVLGLDFKRTDAGRAYGLNNTPEFRRMNPNALVPVLQDGDFTLWESNVIVRYLCAKYSAGALYPADLQQRFNAERWMDWQQTTLNRAGGPAFAQWIRTPPEQRDAKVIAQSVAAMEPLLAMIDAHLATNTFMTGDALSMADIPIACEIHRWWNLPQARPAYPHIERWYTQIFALPACTGVFDLPLA